MSYEALNQYVLAAIAVFAVFLYIGLICAGFVEFGSRMSSRASGKGKSKKRSRNHVTARSLRNTRAPGH